MGIVKAATNKSKKERSKSQKKLEETQDEKPKYTSMAEARKAMLKRNKKKKD